MIEQFDTLCRTCSGYLYVLHTYEKNNDREHACKKRQNEGESRRRLSFMTRAHIRTVILPSLHPFLLLSSQGLTYTRIRSEGKLKKRWKMDRQRLFFFLFLSYTYIHICVYIFIYEQSTLAIHAIDASYFCREKRHTDGMIHTISISWMIYRNRIIRFDSWTLTNLHQRNIMFSDRSRWVCQKDLLECLLF